VLILLQSTQSVLWPEFKKQLVAAHALRPEQLKEPCILSPNELREYAVLCEMPIVFFQLYLKLRTGYGMLRSKIAFLKTSLPR
jgi:hypothetical protein